MATVSKASDATGPSETSQGADITGSRPVMRMFAVLEFIASQGDFVSIQMLARETGLPKPTLHRMLNSFVAEGLLIRQTDPRLYGTSPRLRAFAESLLFNATQTGARHTVLRALVNELGETCNITTLSGDEVLYLDRVETPEPLRFHLGPGSRVPIHCSASGKLLVSQMSKESRHALLSRAELEEFTDATITDFDALEAELDRTRERGFGIDDGEFIHGLVCFAVLVPGSRGHFGQCVAVQGPDFRISSSDVERFVPPLRRAAQALREIEDESRRASYGVNSST